MDREATIVMVTGASSGIGLAVALLAAARGDHVVLLAREPTALAEAARQCENAGAASVLVLAADVGIDAEVKGAVAAVRGRHGRLDAVVGCAGVVAYGRLEDIPVEVFDGVLQTNLIGSVNLARHVIPLLRAQERGTLVLVGSMVGHIAVPTMGPYVLSKWGVRVLARQLSIENRDLPGVKVAYVAPGGVDTPIYGIGGNYTGSPGRPPPPVATPESLARLVLRHVDHHTARSQSNPVNYLVIFGFTVLPRVYDALVGPLFSVAAKDRTQPLAPTAGNVARSRPQDHDLHGAQGSALLGIAKNLWALLRHTGTEA